MPNEYTRQRQGRDFIVHNQIHNVEMSIEDNYNNIDGIIENNDLKDDGEKKQTLQNRLDYYKKVAERNVVPVDGAEPQEKERNLV